MLSTYVGDQGLDKLVGVSHVGEDHSKVILWGP